MSADWAVTETRGPVRKAATSPVQPRDVVADVPMATGLAILQRTHGSPLRRPRSLERGGLSAAAPQELHVSDWLRQMEGAEGGSERGLTSPTGVFTQSGSRPCPPRKCKPAAVQVWIPQSRRLLSRCQELRPRARSCPRGSRVSWRP